MTWAHITNGAIDETGSLPDVSFDGTRWWDLRPGQVDPALAGWFQVVETTRPADTDTATSDPSIVLVDGTPTRVWTARPWTADELAARADLAARVTDVETRLAILEQIVIGNETPPASGSEPTFADLTASQNGAIYPGQVFKWTDGQIWTCITGPLNSTATPVTYPIGYSLTTAPITAWAVGVSYKIGDKVTYEGHTWQCIGANLSQASWAPGLAPSLWTEIS